MSTDKPADKAEEYRRYAERAREVARSHKDPMKQAEWEHVAEVWDRLAESEERIHRPEH